MCKRRWLTKSRFNQFFSGIIWNIIWLKSANFGIIFLQICKYSKFLNILDQEKFNNENNKLTIVRLSRTMSQISRLKVNAKKFTQCKLMLEEFLINFKFLFPSFFHFKKTPLPLKCWGLYFQTNIVWWTNWWRSSVCKRPGNSLTYSTWRKWSQWEGP